MPPTRLASVHGVRPGPWLRRQGAPVRGVPSGKPMPVAGETVHVRLPAAGPPDGGQPITVRLRRKSCPVPVVRCGGRREKGSSGKKLRTPQQAIVGSKTRSAGRTPSSTRASDPSGCPQAHGLRPNQAREVHMDVVVTGRHCELSDRFRESRRREAGPAREARPPDHAGPGRGRERAQPAPARPRRAGRADRVLQGPGDPGRGRRRGQDGRPRPRPRQDGRPDAPGRRPAARPPRPARPGLGRRGARRRPLEGGEPSDDERRRPSARSARSR